jgi:hypothetical protein
MDGSDIQMAIFEIWSPACSWCQVALPVDSIERTSIEVVPGSDKTTLISHCTGQDAQSSSTLPWGKFLGSLLCRRLGKLYWVPSVMYPLLSIW